MLNVVSDLGFLNTLSTEYTVLFDFSCVGGRHGYDVSSHCLSQETPCCHRFVEL